MAEPVTETETEPEEESPRKKLIKRILLIIFHILFISYFIWCTVVFIRYDKKSDNCKTAVKDLSKSWQYRDESEGESVIVSDKDNETIANITNFQPHILCKINWCTGFGFLTLIFTIFYIFTIYYFLFKPYIGQKLYDNTIEPIIDKWMEFSRQLVVSIVMLILVILFMAAVLGFESRKEPAKLIGVIGPILFILFGFAVCPYRKEIPWRIVVTGILAQFLLCLFCVRWSFGRSIFQCAGDKVAVFLGFTSHGARFVYGDRICNEFVFAFAILAVIFFFSVVTSCLYYLGVMQFILNVFGWLLQALIGTTVCESVNAAGNVFLGMTESPLIIRPYIERLTKSELHTICVSGYATVAGTVLGAYISFGASPAYLITASVMAAPASLAFAKLFLPEIEESQTKADNIQLEKSTDSSILDAAASGAANGVAIVLGIVSNIIAFIAIIAFFNAVVEWLFQLGGKEDVTFLWLLSQAFIPLVFVMGVPWHDCEKVALVVAKKTLINEFLGYMDLGAMIRNNEIGARSAGIATFALCGFANPGSLGIMIAGLSAMAPSRRPDITRVAVRAFFAGSIVSFTSASFAGILIQPDELDDISNKLLDAVGVNREDVSDYFFNA
ncbi:solute carrier family 28 member 3 [Scaptodrosophila lebanonensis]|uniref:Solute carrier family 28 member 3 n=1 Tax=Drosophila lebanonensis TaxID=7225 RepID=A0A6J2TV42_DROLE|nr:solute carrier family 28 member 3 [Scaptodrosophila lebanonensis]